MDAHKNADIDRTYLFVMPERQWTSMWKSLPFWEHGVAHETSTKDMATAEMGYWG